MTAKDLVPEDTLHLRRIAGLLEEQDAHMSKTDTQLSMILIMLVDLKDELEGCNESLRYIKENAIVIGGN